ncbi:GntR family transcriptional regulator [Clostridium sp. BJN0001]|uniref:GntR family transcriptional regulator n=1 Tax=Clostridium sp. BJN0001 TaxID=2930219 RepID=UPI001FCF95D7|nr:GntR family transcriptional regulator [Clostridium sp. BJN0001]
MKILLSNKSDVPIYEQIKSQIKEQIISEDIKEGESLPSIRHLAKELSISVITTTRAYRDLEKEGFIATVKGKGSYVLPKDIEFLKEQYLKNIENCFIEAIKISKLASIDDKELLNMLQNLISTD